jgi:hypothetical protein
MDKVYLFSFNILDERANADSVHTFIKHAREIKDWWHYLPGVYLFTSYRNAVYLSNMFRDFLPNVRLLVVEINPEIAGGALPKEAWDWINSHRYDQTMGALFRSKE